MLMQKEVQQVFLYFLTGELKIIEIYQVYLTSLQIRCFLQLKSNSCSLYLNKKHMLCELIYVLSRNKKNIMWTSPLLYSYGIQSHLSSVYVVCWIFLQTFQTYFCIQANTVDPDQTAPKSWLFAKMTFKITSRWQSRRQLLWLTA